MPIRNTPNSSELSNYDALAYILFTHYNSPFTVTAIIKYIFDSVRIIALHLCSACAAAARPLA